MREKDARLKSEQELSAKLKMKLNEIKAAIKQGYLKSYIMH